MRSNMKTGTADRPQEMFGFKTTAQAFRSSKNSCDSIPEIKKLLQNRMFRDRAVSIVNASGEEDAGDIVQMFRHPSILQMLRRIYFGNEAVLTGKRSNMARRAYVQQWDAQQVPPMIIAFAATMVRISITNSHF
jgi:Domain of unknown function (DUF6532)